MAYSEINKHEMPELEEIKSVSRLWLITWPFFFLIPALWFTIAITQAAITHHPKTYFAIFIRDFGVIFTISMLAVLCVIILKFWRSGAWRTNRRGIKRIGVFGEQFMSWDDIISVEIESCQRERYCTIRLSSPNNIFHIDTDNNHLAASIIMHIQRHELAVSGVIPASVLSLLAEPSADIIQEITWSTRQPLPWWRTIACGVMVLLSAFVSISYVVNYFNSPEDRNFVTIILAPVIGAMAPIYIVYINMATYTATAFTLFHDYFIARTIRGTFTHQWEEITHAYWTGDWYGKMNIDRQPGVPSPSRIALALHTGNRKVVYIPWDSDDEKSTALMHTVMQRLKLLPKPIHLPIPDRRLE